MLAVFVAVTPLLEFTYSLLAVSPGDIRADQGARRTVCELDYEPEDVCTEAITASVSIIADNWQAVNPGYLTTVSYVGYGCVTSLKVFFAENGPLFYPCHGGGCDWPIRHCWDSSGL